jgi:hypothetical protein
MWDFAAHAPGNTPLTLRRSYYLAVGHGAKLLNFRGAAPHAADGPFRLPADATAMWQTIHDLVHETGAFEHVVFPARPRPSRVGMLLSFASDLWDPDASADRERQNLYLACRRIGYSVDCLTEEDVQAGKHQNLKAILVVGPNLERATARALRAWVNGGGILASYGGGGLRDEYDRPLDVLQEVFGISEPKAERRGSLGWGKTDLLKLQPLDEILWSQSRIERQWPVLATKVSFTPKPAAQVLGKYKDGKPAVTRHAYGLGVAYVYGSYAASGFVRAALPNQRWERGNSPASFNHFVPSDFDSELVDIITAPCGEGQFDIITDNINVETVVLEGPKGVAVACINWTNTPQDAFLTVQFATHTMTKATSLNRGALKLTKITDPRNPRAVTYSFKLRVDATDMVLLEP